MHNFSVHFFDELGSTNDTAKQMAAEAAPSGTVIIADQQSLGRGRQGNSWVSPKGNLYMSVILREEISAKSTGQLSFLAAVALADTVGKLMRSKHVLQQKWPNDVWVDGKKLSGILLESEYAADTKAMDWIVVGMGVNITAAPEGAIRLKDITDADIDRDKFLDLLLINLDIRLAQWRSEGFSPIQRDWLRNARALDQDIKVRLPKETFMGTFRGIDESGCLLLEQDGNLKKIASGDVFFE